jgi:MinD superfamily P-loop ATPase
MKKPLEIVVLSGKGGTGKTSVTAAFAALAKDSIIVDCDVDAADLHLILSPSITHTENFPSGSKAVINILTCTECGICKNLCSFKAINTIENAYFIDEYACEGCGLCLAACPSDAIQMKEYKNNHIYFADTRFGQMVYGKLGIAEENSGRLVSKIRQYAKETAIRNLTEFILVDGPPGIGCPVISTVTGSDIVVAVTEPTRSGWHDLQRLIEMIHRFRTPVFVIINKFDLNTEMTMTIESNLKSKDIPVIGKIPYDENMLQALIKGKAITEHMTESISAKNLKKVWNLLKEYAYEYQSV